MDYKEKFARMTPGRKEKMRELFALIEIPTISDKDVCDVLDMLASRPAVKQGLQAWGAMDDAQKEQEWQDFYAELYPEHRKILYMIYGPSEIENAAHSGKERTAQKQGKGKQRKTATLSPLSV